MLKKFFISCILFSIILTGIFSYSYFQFLNSSEYTFIFIYQILKSKNAEKIDNYVDLDLIAENLIEEKVEYLQDKHNKIFGILVEGFSHVSKPVFKKKIKNFIIKMIEEGQLSKDFNQEIHPYHLYLFFLCKKYREISIEKIRLNNLEELFICTLLDKGEQWHLTLRRYENNWKLIKIQQKGNP